MMKCGLCGQESDAASRVCPSCGAYMGEKPPDAEAAVPGNPPDLSWGLRPAAARRPGGKPRRRRQKRRSRLTRKNTYQSRMVNWVKVGVFALALLVLLAAAAFIWLKVSAPGQLILARMGRDANADAYWALGTEYLDQGYVRRSIASYLQAEAKAPERPDLGEKLLLLAEAYEAAGQMADAERVYTRIYTELDKKNAAAYRQAIGILLEQDRQPEAVALMQKAYEETGDLGFFNQRSALVPLPPTASLPSGRHMFSKNVSFLSSQDYDIFYTTGEGPLPESGTLFTEPITLNEGTYNFRAVAVSSQLVSDEMSIRYTITLPTPMAPKTNMESKTYPRPIRVSLRIVDEDKEVELYYTIDGTKPTVDSPRYTGEPILLPGGRVLLRAIAVNRYGKRSNEMVVEYKIEAGFKKYFRAEDDQFSQFTLNKTSMDQFVKQFGEPDTREEMEDDAVGGAVTKAVYPWGEARFYQGGEDGLVLYHVDTNSTSMKGPRGSGVGMRMEEVTSRFRDMGQLPNDRGDRGIYYDLVEGYARFTVASDDPLTGVLEYVYAGSPDSTTTILQYRIEHGRVQSVLMRFVNRRLSMVQ